MSTGGHKPGLTAKVKVISVEPALEEVEFSFSDVGDSSYFEVGKEYVAFFMPAPPDNPPSGGNEQGNG